MNPSSDLSSLHPEHLGDLFRAQRTWFHQVFSTIEEQDLLWIVPHTPYTMDWVLWHMAGSCKYVSQVRMKQSHTNATYQEPSKYEKGSHTLAQRIGDFLEQHEHMETLVRTLEPSLLDQIRTYQSSNGPREESVRQVIIEQLYHLAGHITVCRYIHNQRERVEGRPQKWPPH